MDKRVLWVFYWPLERLHVVFHMVPLSATILGLGVPSMSLLAQ